MTNQAPGWYQNSSNETQWWDGHSWGVLARDYRPQHAPGVANRQGRKLRTWIWTIVGAFAIVGAFTGMIFMMGTSFNTYGSLDTKSPQIAESQPSEDIPPAAVENDVPPERLPTLDESMAADGWAVVEPNETYYRFFTEAERAASSCGTFACSWVVIHSVSGCGSGFYVKADIIANSTPVSWTNAISASAQPGESVVVTLEDVGGSGNQFRVAELSCMR